MENQDRLEDLFDVEVDATAKKLIKDIALWAKVVVISALTSYLITLAVAFFGKANTFEGFSATTSKAAEVSGALVVIIIGVIINIFLYRFR